MANEYNNTLKGKTAVITGSSTGIGAAIAYELAGRGANIVINYPYPSVKDEAENALQLILEDCDNIRGIIVEANLCSIEGPKELIKKAVENFGEIHILVNNAALAINKSLEEHTLDDWDLIVNLNGRGTFLSTQAVLPHLAKQSRIINICSASSRGPPPFQTIYAGTKGMVDSFTKVWAKELPKKYSCTVNAVSPGPTKTKGFMEAGEEAMKILQPTIELIPVAARMGEPEEIAYAVACLAEDRASWINGVHLHVNGGLYID
ncbi:uncharacterized protein PRCAT00005101001 [Priceomyces carsonii]|uniref:uncharacterized protein n=1 Tax=Priceomyces carsonii TaxID=28549 RepID=UPI002ED8EA4D|nr:unnamed protein product [Priceomyces carsonii]